MAETVAGQENFTYIPLSSFIILLVILLTCASRRKQKDAFNGVEQNDIKGEYAIMCFPCLKKKPQLKEFEPSEDLSDQFEYIVEKYTIRKVPLLLANTAEDIIERQRELELARTPPSQPQLIKNDFVNFQAAQEVYNVQRVPPCVTVAANTGCPGRKAVKEKLKAADILESMSPVCRPPVRNQNYVAIPTKGSLRHKDIMITKREITNQYLNNFSSVFVDNLKDHIPKDPERLPSLSRPYTSALRSYPIAENTTKATSSKKSKRNKSHKVAYAFPEEDHLFKDEQPYYDSDSGMDQTTDMPESECQEDNENDTGDLSDKSKSLVLLNDSESVKDVIECVPNPFKTTIKSSVSEIDQNPISPAETDFHTTSFFSHKEDWTNLKNVTYEDIQALDVGYEFTSCEKLGVKPKMTRIHYPHETDRIKETIKQLALGDSKTSKRSFLGSDQASGKLPSKLGRGSPKPPTRASELGLFTNNFVQQLRKVPSRGIITETSFLPKKEDIILEEAGGTTNKNDVSTTTFTSKSEESKTPSLNDLAVTPSIAMEDSVAEISKLYELTSPITQRLESSNVSSEFKEQEESTTRFPAPSKSRSFHEVGRPGSRKEHATEVKGKDYLPYRSPNCTKKAISRVDGHETETSYSLYSHESKTSSVVTSPRSSEPDDGKRATLRWKIVIKHHRDDDSSKKNVNVNKKQ